jgi:hypothetical protein
VSQSADEVLLSSQKEVDDFFDHQRMFLLEYHTRIKDATGKSDRMTKSHKSQHLVLFATCALLSLFDFQMWPIAISRFPQGYYNYQLLMNPL